MRIKEKILHIMRKVKKSVFSIFKEFKDFNYKALKSKEGWISFLKNKRMLISSIVIIAVIVIIPILITTNGNNGRLSTNNQKIYAALCNVNTSGGKFDKAVSSVMAIRDVNIIQDETGLYLVTLTGSPYSKYPGLNAYESIAVTYSVKSEAGGCSFVSCKGTTEFGQTFNIDYSVWNASLQASQYN